MTNKIKMILSNKVFRTALLVIILGLIISSGLLIYGHLMVTRIIDVKGKIIDLSEPSTGKRYRRLVEDYNNSKEGRQLLTQVRPTKQEIAYFVQMLDELAIRSQVKQTVEVATQRDAPGDIKYVIPSIRYELNVAGSQGSVINFMKEVGKLPYLLRVVSLETRVPQDKELAGETLGTIIIDIASRE